MYSNIEPWSSLLRPTVYSNIEPWSSLLRPTVYSNIEPWSSLLRPTVYSNIEPWSSWLRPTVYSNIEPWNSLLRPTVYSNIEPWSSLLRPTVYSNMHRFIWNAALNAEREIAHRRLQASVIVFDLHLLPSLFEITVRQSRMASYISRSTPCVVCRSTHIVSQCHFTFAPPTSSKPSRLLRMWISSPNCSSRRCLLGEYLKTIANV